MGHRNSPCFQEFYPEFAAGAWVTINSESKQKMYHLGILTGGAAKLIGMPMQVYYTEGNPLREHFRKFLKSLNTNTDFLVQSILRNIHLPYSLFDMKTIPFVLNHKSSWTVDQQQQ